MRLRDAEIEFQSLSFIGASYAVTAPISDFAGYSVTGFSEMNLTFAAGESTAASISKVLASLIRELCQKGILKGTTAA